MAAEVAEKASDSILPADDPKNTFALEECTTKVAVVLEGSERAL